MRLLGSMPYIRHTRRAAVGQLAEQWLSSHRIEVNDVMEMESIESVTSMVLHNLGVSIVPDLCVPDSIFSSLQRLPLPTPRPGRVLGMLSRQDSRKRLLVDRLVEQLAQIAAGSG